ncbi:MULTISPECIES: hypothetical protein [unclassified Streptomyces]|uniref:hypothetical protein n=1 Tax=unclassified Streptomyces TaxID=2593676 RepID=UPI000BAC7721|nr:MULTISPECIES: hypothetical protein [unclassified Streptomyces]ASY37052.1 hypothetical protein CAC01_30940 [Streptomyces sp. CLI2509]MYX21164.1 hypothetical protein [Streptomyces sp. SID8380]
MAATRTRTKRPPARKKSVAPHTSARPAPATATPALTVSTQSGPVDEELARLADARDRGADIVDAAREQAATFQTRAEEEYARTIAATQQQATSLLAEARDRAARITTEADRAAGAAETRAAEELVRARQEGEVVLSEAHQRADALLKAARTQLAELADQTTADREVAGKAASELRRLAEEDLAALGTLIEKRRQEAGALLERAQDQADDLLAATRRETEAARSRAARLAEDARKEYDARRSEAQKLYDDAVQAADERRCQADAKLTAARAETEQARDALREELRAMGARFDEEAATKRAALDADLDELRRKCDKQRETLRQESTTVAAQLREAAQKQADRITAEAEKKAKAVTERAQADEARARRLLEEAKVAKQATSRWRGWQHRAGNKMWKTAPWIALAAGVGLAATGEFELARMVGINEYVAPLLPVSIDVYCVTAFRAQRDIPAALALMASANVTYHLAEQAHLVKDGHSAPWWLTTFVVLIFVAVIWRVHSLMHDTGTDSHPVPDTNGTPVQDSTASGNLYAASVRDTGTSARRTDLYASASPVRSAASGSAAVGTHPVRPALAATPDESGNRAVNSANSNRTDGVHPPGETSERTGSPDSVQGGRTHQPTPGVQGRTGSGRTRPVPGTGAARTEASSTGRSGSGTGSGPRTGPGRTGTPVRTDAELRPLLDDLPRDENGYVSLYQARTQLSVNQNRAVRLLADAGLLRPGDADKHLS